MEKTNDVERIVRAIGKATGGEFFMDSFGSTMMGGGPDVYDEEGRLVSVDPNWKFGKINIEGTTYPVVRKGWHVWIFKPEYPDATYTWCWKEDRDKYVLTDFSIEPDYVVAYRERKDVEFEDLKRRIVEEGHRIAFLISDEEANTLTYLFAYGDNLAVVELGVTDKFGNAKNKWSNVKNFRLMSEYWLGTMLAGIDKYAGRMKDRAASARYCV